ncbi:alpha/beta fold hydrolase [Actinocorallia populi]|uniref:alpha/beta fold hydrolase n=1 Tax=Actinocorallia populi TaxID=2079200 RepID=UPI001E638AD9|nr:alpha/beta fold hydrolase [Actinocorallia populi]
MARKLLSGGLADLRPTPSEPFGQGPGHRLYRYRPSGKVIPTGPPVLLVPPPAPAAAAAFDLRRGCSLAEHLVATGHRVYLLDLGPGCRRTPAPDLGTWVDEVLPRAVAEVSRDVDGQPVQLVGWCLGGILCVLAAAARPALPVASITSVAAPVDRDAARRGGPLHELARFAEGAEATLLTFFGGIPRPVAESGYRLPGIDRYLTRPMAVLTHLDDADFLAQTEAEDAFAAEMSDHPAAGLYERFLPGNALARGEVRIGGRQVALADVRVPVLVIAGRDDRSAPWRSVHPLTRLLPHSPDVRFATAPGGHLGVLTGRRARTTTWARLDAWLAEGRVRHGLRAPRQRRERLASRS